MNKINIKAYFIRVSNFEVAIINNFTLPLKCMPYIYQPMHFKKYQAKIKAQFHFCNMINVMTLVYIAKLGSKTKLINIKV